VFCLYAYYYYYRLMHNDILRIYVYKKDRTHTILFFLVVFIEMHYCYVPITVKFLPYFITTTTTTTTTTQRHDGDDELTKYYYGSVSLHYSRLAHKSSLSIIIFIQQFAEFRQLYYLCTVRLCGRGILTNA